eukprot:1858705-Rhodomonas_salina.1
MRQGGCGASVEANGAGMLSDAEAPGHVNGRVSVLSITRRCQVGTLLLRPGSARMSCSAQFPRAAGTPRSRAPQSSNDDRRACVWLQFYLNTRAAF